MCLPFFCFQGEVGETIVKSWIQDAVTPLEMQPRQKLLSPFLWESTHSVTLHRLLGSGAETGGCPALCLSLSTKSEGASVMELSDDLAGLLLFTTTRFLRGALVAMDTNIQLYMREGVDRLSLSFDRFLTNNAKTTVTIELVSLKTSIMS